MALLKMPGITSKLDVESEVAVLVKLIEAAHLVHGEDEFLAICSKRGRKLLAQLRENQQQRSEVNGATVDDVRTIVDARVESLKTHISQEIQAGLREVIANVGRSEKEDCKPFGTPSGLCAPSSRETTPMPSAIQPYRVGAEHPTERPRSDHVDPKAVKDSTKEKITCPVCERQQEKMARWRCRACQSFWRRLVDGEVLLPTCDHTTSTGDCRGCRRRRYELQWLIHNPRRRLPIAPLSELGRSRQNKKFLPRKLSKKLKIAARDDGSGRGERYDAQAHSQSKKPHKEHRKRERSPTQSSSSSSSQ